MKSIKIFLFLVVTVFLSGCAIFGNTGPVELSCTETITVCEYKLGQHTRMIALGVIDAEEPFECTAEDLAPMVTRDFSLKLPMGSGREYSEGASGPCDINIPKIEQGEDRSPGILTFLSGLIL